MTVESVAMMTRIYLMRHAQSATNKAGTIAGQLDPTITVEGHRQSRQAKDALGHIEFDEVYSSNLRRAVKTAEIVSGRKVPKSHQLIELRERNWGEMEGKPDHHLHDYSVAFMRLHPDARWDYRHVAGMENDNELTKRFIRALKLIAERHKGKTVLVVSHGAAIRTSMIRLGFFKHEHLPPKSFNNNGFVVLDYDGQKFKLHSIEGIEQAVVDEIIKSNSASNNSFKK